MQPIILILLAMPSLCYAHGDSFIVLGAGIFILQILLISLLSFLFVKNEKSESSFNKSVIRSILIFLLIVAFAFFIALFKYVGFVLLISLLLFLNEKSESSFKTKLVIRSILYFLLIAAIVLFLVWTFSF
jgi:hypothetical protein